MNPTIIFLRNTTKTCTGHVLSLDAATEFQ